MWYSPDDDIDILGPVPYRVNKEGSEDHPIADLPDLVKPVLRGSMREL